MDAFKGRTPGKIRETLPDIPLLPFKRPRSDDRPQESNSRACGSSKKNVTLLACSTIPQGAPPLPKKASSVGYSSLGPIAPVNCSDRPLSDWNTVLNPDLACAEADNYFLDRQEEVGKNACRPPLLSAATDEALHAISLWINEHRGRERERERELEALRAQRDGTGEMRAKMGEADRELASARAAAKADKEEMDRLREALREEKTARLQLEEKMEKERASAEKALLEERAVKEKLAKTCTELTDMCDEKVNEAFGNGCRVGAQLLQEAVAPHGDDLPWELIEDDFKKSKSLCRYRDGQIERLPGDAEEVEASTPAVEGVVQNPA